MWDQLDNRYWIDKEEEIETHLVDVSAYGFVVDYVWFRLGLTDDPVCRARKGAAEALVRAREALPGGLNFKIYDGWRPWTLQQNVSESLKAEIQAAHPDWDAAQVTEQVWLMAPPLRIMPRLCAHRYGGAFDLTVVDESGEELDTGVPVHYVTGPEAALLWYEFIDAPSERELRARNNRRTLIRAMQRGGFNPYLEEFWHWNCLRDMEHEARAFCHEA